MSRDTIAAGLNAAAGLAIVVWLCLSVMPLVLGLPPLAGGGNIAIIAAGGWFGWNCHLIMPRRK